MLVLRKAATVLDCLAAGCDERRVGVPVMKDIHYRTGEEVFLACAAAARRCASSASIGDDSVARALVLASAHQISRRLGFDPAHQGGSAQ
jgi:hypothetical protein